MSKLSASEALELISVSKTTLYSDMEKGVVSYDLDAKGRKRVDIAELQRVYGPLDISTLDHAVGCCAFTREVRNIGARGIRI